MLRSTKLFAILFSAVVCSAVVIGGCSTTKKAAVAPSPEQKVRQPQPDDYLNQIITYQTFSGKVNMHILTPDLNQNVTANIRMNKGKDVWASVLAMGVAEVARAYVTPDSVLAISRIGKKAYALGYEEGTRLLRADIPFPSFQNLWIGNPLLHQGTDKKMQMSDTAVWITLKKDDMTQVLGYNAQTRLLEKLILKSDTRDFICEIDYSDYRPLALKQPFSFQRHIQIREEGKHIVVDLAFTRAAVNVPVETGFQIPPSYTLEPFNSKQ